MSNLLMGERVIAVLPALVRKLDSLSDAVVLQQLHYWMDRTDNEYDGHVWVYKTYDEWSEEIGLGSRQIRYSMQRLENLGLVVSLQLDGGDRRKSYRVNYDHPFLVEDDEQTKRQIRRMVEPSDKIVRPSDKFGASSDKFGACTITTEITTEITHKDSRSTFSSEIVELGDFFMDSLVNVLGLKRKPVTKAWLTDIQRMVNLDERTPDQIKKAITWAHQDTFWAKNILSPAKLREKYDQLRLAAQAQSRSKKPATGLTVVQEMMREITVDEMSLL